MTSAEPPPRPKQSGSHQYQTDADSGLMLPGNRYYDCSIGRFISQDPAQDESNWYSYCGNNPLVAVDPTGLVSKPLWETALESTLTAAGGALGFLAGGGGDLAAAAATGGTALVAAPAAVAAGTAAGSTLGLASAKVLEGIIYAVAGSGGSAGGSGGSGSGGASTPRIEDPQSMKGMKPQDARKLVPKEWGAGQPTTKGIGTKWFEPGTKGANGIRIMQGDPAARSLDHQGPYMIRTLNGVKTRVLLQGNPAL